MEVEYDENKLKELVLYVAARTKNDPSFGATKLNKVLYFSDFFYYAKSGKPITGAAYQKLEHGPAPRRLLPVRQSLVLKGDALLDKSKWLGRFRVTRIIPTRGPNMSLFTEDEIEFVDQVIEAVSAGTADDASLLSHREVGWTLADHGEDIPYFTVWLSYVEPTHDDLRRAEELADKLLPV